MGMVLALDSSDGFFITGGFHIARFNSTQLFSWVASCDVNVLTTQLNSTEFAQFFGILNISRPCPVELS
jgi:hypothetical protein